MQLHDVPRAREFAALVRERLPEKTARHSLSVAQLMLSIADEAGIEAPQAAAAGLLHDIYKATKASALLQAATEFGLQTSDVQRARPMLLHGPVAAAYCRQELDIDEAVYDAIYWHTTGRPGLGEVGLALYFADFAEPFRTHPGAAEARGILQRDGFRAALGFVSEQKLAHLLTKPNIDPATHGFHAWLKPILDGAAATSVRSEKDEPL